MHGMEMETSAGFGRERHVEPIRVWIENRDGSIARGHVDVLSEDGASARLAGAVPVASGEDVTVRMAFDWSSPTLGAAARVLWVRPAGDEMECELEWTHSGPERELLACVVTSLG